jgi:hypothetical protein
MNNVELIWGEACFVASRRDTLGPKSKVLGLRYRTRQLAMDAAARDYAKLHLASRRKIEP